MGRSQSELRDRRCFYGLLGLVLLSRNAAGFRNVTLDDTNANIIYTGTWLKSTTVSDRIGGTTHYTKVQGSYARFQFGSAAALYFIGYGLVAENIEDGTVIDVEFDGTLHRVDQQRGERGQTLIWSSGPIDVNINHTIKITKTSKDNSGFDVNVDAFILTVPEVGDVTTTSPAMSSTSSNNGASSSTTPGSQSLSPAISSTSSSSPGAVSNSGVPSLVWLPTDIANTFSTSQSTGVPNASSNNPPSNSTSTAAIAGGVVGAVVVLSGIAIFFYMLGRRRRHASIPTVEHAYSYNDGAVGAGDGLYPKTSIDGTGSAVQSDVGRSGSATLMSSLPVMTEKGRIGRAPVASHAMGSEQNTQSGGQSSYDDAESSLTWATGPPAYDQLVSPRSLPSIPLSNVREE